MFERFKPDDGYEEVFSAAEDNEPVELPIVRYRVPLKKRILSWFCNAVVLLVAVTVFLVINAAGLREQMPALGMKLHALPLPMASSLEGYSGWSRLDIAHIAAIGICMGCILCWIQLCRGMQDHGALEQLRRTNVAYFYLKVGAAGILLLGDALIFYSGLASKAMSSFFGETPVYVPIVATLIYLACGALIGVMHADTLES